MSETVGNSSPKMPQLAVRCAPSDTASLSDDLLWGIKPIANFLGKTQRQAFHLAATGQIPTGKVGGRIVGSRSVLRAHFAALVSGDA